ncbi:BQ2448_1057 [Microbotryum intermedium]|uniref:chitin deacetylase n=1 Tax=Microbotryum intermedium TaxID=269621 RepID=A0A238FCD0_9BASI|nr:BQ2448_1057 [Microbotryum intermedium]
MHLPLCLLALKTSTVLAASSSGAAAAASSASAPKTATAAVAATNATSVPTSDRTNEAQEAAIKNPQAECAAYYYEPVADVVSTFFLQPPGTEDHVASIASKPRLRCRTPGVTAHDKGLFQSMEAGIPNIAPRGTRAGDFSGVTYDMNNDPDCWWTDTRCTTPKLAGLEPDITRCPEPNTWGFTLDDGPNCSHNAVSRRVDMDLYKLFPPPPATPKDSPTPSHRPTRASLRHETDSLGFIIDSCSTLFPYYSTSQYFDYLLSINQKATLFYIGSNVLDWPLEAQRGLTDGHEICSHTWSHPCESYDMTSMTNEQAFAELYFSKKAIKNVLGITVRCVRMPYGDVDDRIRYIASKLDLRIIQWETDTFDYDWNVDGIASVQKNYDTILAQQANGTYNSYGPIVLSHEIDGETMAISQSYLPKMRKTFTGGVIPVGVCLNNTQPYVEGSEYVYPNYAQYVAGTVSISLAAPTAVTVDVQLALSPPATTAGASTVPASSGGIRTASGASSMTTSRGASATTTQASASASTTVKSGASRTMTVGGIELGWGLMMGSVVALLSMILVL